MFILTSIGDAINTGNQAAANIGAGNIIQGGEEIQQAVLRFRQQDTETSVKKAALGSLQKMEGLLG